MSISVVATPALAPALPELGREFEALAGYAIVPRYVTAGAMAAGVSGCDVAIGTKPVIAALQALGQLRTCGARDIARVGLGVQSRRGARKPDIETVEALRRAILEAGTIGYIDPAGGGAAGAHTVRILEKLGIAEPAATKTRLIGGAALIDAVASGEVEIGFAPISEILSDARVELVGPVPAVLQEMTMLSAAVACAGDDPRAAQAFVDFLVNPLATEVLAKRGLRG